mmetsp:Transcript_31986/g.49975  ORF Transcript_31986/g.49975 Transcript_31986/m.49975 type:complete len:158 (+) Transcript_31986:200-673(+)
MAGYVAPSVVSEHAKIDLDIKDIEAAGTDWAAIKQIYMEGKNSAKSSGLRNLQSMSTSFSSGSDEYWAKIAHDYWGAWDFADQHLMAVLDGTDSALYGNYATGVYASTDAARKQVPLACPGLKSLALNSLSDAISFLCPECPGPCAVDSGDYKPSMI